MFFDLRSLIELLTSSIRWTTDTCERILASFDLKETTSAPGRRDFTASSGLRACLYSKVDGSPERIEFPFALPESLRGKPELINRYVHFKAWPLKAELGEPNSARHGDTQRLAWSLPIGTVTVAPDATSAGAVENVALILEPPTRS
jgi:hypothetical protein